MLSNLLSQTGEKSALVPHFNSDRLISHIQRYNSEYIKQLNNNLIPLFKNTAAMHLTSNLVTRVSSTNLYFMWQYLIMCYTCLLSITVFDRRNCWTALLSYLWKGKDIALGRRKGDMLFLHPSPFSCCCSSLLLQCYISNSITSAKSKLSPRVWKCCDSSKLQTDNYSLCKEMWSLTACTVDILKSEQQQGWVTRAMSERLS